LDILVFFVIWVVVVVVGIASWERKSKICPNLLNSDIPDTDDSCHSLVKSWKDEH
jgi:hypothetical protein